MLQRGHSHGNGEIEDVVLGMRAEAERKFRSQGDTCWKDGLCELRNCHELREA